MYPENFSKPLTMEVESKASLQRGMYVYLYLSAYAYIHIYIYMCIYVYEKLNMLWKAPEIYIYIFMYEYLKKCIFMYM